MFVAEKIVGGQRSRLLLFRVARYSETMSHPDAEENLGLFYARGWDFSVRYRDLVTNPLIQLPPGSPLVRPVDLLIAHLHESSWKSPKLASSVASGARCCAHSRSGSVSRVQRSASLRCPAQKPYCRPSCRLHDGKGLEIPLTILLSARQGKGQRDPAAQ